MLIPAEQRLAGMSGDAGRGSSRCHAELRWEESLAYSGRRMVWTIGYTSGLGKRRANLLFSSLLLSLIAFSAESTGASQLTASVTSGVPCHSLPPVEVSDAACSKLRSCFLARAAYTDIAGQCEQSMVARNVGGGNSASNSGTGS